MSVKKRLGIGIVLLVFVSVMYVFFSRTSREEDLQEKAEEFERTDQNIQMSLSVDEKVDNLTILLKKDFSAYQDITDVYMRLVPYPMEDMEWISGLLDAYLPEVDYNSQDMQQSSVEDNYSSGKLLVYKDDKDYNVCTLMDEYVSIVPEAELFYTMRYMVLSSSLAFRIDPVYRSFIENIGENAEEALIKAEYFSDQIVEKAGGLYCKNNKKIYRIDASAIRHAVEAYTDDIDREQTAGLDEYDGKDIYVIVYPLEVNGLPASEDVRAGGIGGFTSSYVLTTEEMLLGCELTEPMEIKEYGNEKLSIDAQHALDILKKGLSQMKLEYEVNDVQLVYLETSEYTLSEEETVIRFVPAWEFSLEVIYSDGTKENQIYQINALDGNAQLLGKGS